MLFFDAHCDVLSVISKPEELFSNRFHWDGQRALSNGPYIQVFSTYAGSKYRNDPKTRMQAQLEKALAAEKKDPDRFKIIRTRDDLNEVAEDGGSRFYGLLGAEGSEILGGELPELDRLYEIGLRVLTLVWNYDNDVCDSVAGHRTNHGLSAFGAEVVKKAQQLGILIDLSHASDETFEQVMAMTDRPLTASHSNARALCPHRRNLTDDQIKAISKRDGVIGVNFYPPFLVAAGNAQIVDIIRHIEYISALVGTRFIGFGSDFDGIENMPAGISGVQDLSKVIEALFRLNYTEETVKAIAGGNFLRLIKQILLT